MNLTMDVKRKEFYQGYRKYFENRLTQGQVNGFEAILNFVLPARIPVNRIAYILATAYHETGKTMEPVREGFAESDEQAIRIITRMYEQGRISRNYALPDPVTGKSYYGRGLVQITHKDNYARLGKVTGTELEKDPDLALDLNIAVRILVLGMNGGLFTGKKLADYIPVDGKPDYYNARRIVNGLDKASLIAGYAERFEKIIQLL